jgi:hypothetical protein
LGNYVAFLPEYLSGLSQDQAVFDGVKRLLDGVYVLGVKYLATFISS